MRCSDPAKTQTLKFPRLTLLFFLSTWVFHAQAEVPSELQGAINEYEIAFASATNGNGSMESLFKSAKHLADTGTSPLGSGSGGASKLELLSDAEFDALKLRLSSLEIYRYEVVGIEPKASVFLDLVKHFGNAADIAFLEAYLATYPENEPIANYRLPVTDYSACTTYGGGKLSDAYLRWLQYQKDFTQKYKDFVAKEIQSTRDRIEGVDGD